MTATIDFTGSDPHMTSGAGSPAAIDADAFDTMIGRLSRLSVDKHFDAYVDVPWDDPTFALSPTDERLRLPAIDPLSTNEWVLAQPPETQSLLALYRYAACMKIGWHFENLLQRGLLILAFRTPNGAPEFRYLNHEIIEESQHSLMFQEFVNRSGLPVRGMARSWRVLAEIVVPPIARRLPGLFFLLVLGGEDPVDHLQKSMLREGIGHPLVERVMRIHVTEEARHLSFARQMLKRDVPEGPRAQRLLLTIAGPLVLGIMARMMLVPPADLCAGTGLPKAEVTKAYRSAAGRRLLSESVSKTRKLWAELGLMPRWVRPLWKLMGIAELPPT
jgi:hypothetical protein